MAIRSLSSENIDGSVLISNNEFYKAKSTSGTNYKIAGLTSGNVIQIGALDYTSAGTIFAGGDNISITTGGASGSTRIKINSSGNVGIGTSSPNHKLDIYSNENIPLRIHRPSNSNLDSAGAHGIGFSTRSDAITSTTDTRSGIFSYYNGNLFFATNTSSIEADPDASARMTILNTGYVGIGTMTPGDKLHIEGGVIIQNGNNISWGGLYSANKPTIFASTNYIQFAPTGASQVASASMKLTTTGLGIGTSSPAQKLEVVNSGFAYVRTRSTAGSFTGFDIGQHTGGGIYLNNRDNTAMVFMTNNTERMNILAGGTGTFYNAFSIQGDDKSLIVRNAAGTVIGTMGAESSSTPNVGMTTIRNNGTTTIQFNSNGSSYINGGNVGLGTTSPQFTLNVVGASATEVTVARFSKGNYADSGGHTTIVGLGAESGIAWTKAAIAFERTGGYDTGNIHFLQEDTIDNSTAELSDSVMTITKTGNVGIGTTSPAYKLDVSGGNMAIRNSVGPQLLFFEPGRAYTDGMRLLRYQDKLSLTYGWNANEEALTVVGGTGSDVGNVGIGTTSPSTFLQVSGQGNRAGGNIQMGLSSQGANKWSYLTGTHYNSTTEPEGFALIGGYSDIDENRVVIGGDIWETNPATSIHFWTHSSSTHAQGGTQRMVINSSGNVGIGTTTPGAKLDVNGELYVRNVIYAYAGAGNQIGGISWLNPDSGFLFLKSGNVTKVSLNSNGSSYINGGALGIGTTAPFSDLSINVGANAPSSSGNMASEGLTVHNGAGGRAVQIGVNESGAYNYIQSSYVNNSNVAVNLAFFTGATERMRIGSNGYVGMGIANTNNQRITLAEADANGSHIKMNNSRTGGGYWVNGVGDDGSSASIVPPGGIFWYNGATRMVIDSAGNVGIGTTLPVHRLHVEDNGNVVRFYNTGSSNSTLTLRADGADGTDSAIQVSFRDTSDNTVGSITSTGNGTAFNTSSDYRLKENVVEMTDALDRVSQLKPSRFNFIANPDKTYDGFLAHEVQDIVPEAISGDKDEVDEDGNEKYQGIDQSKLVPLLVGAIQELKKEIEILKNK
jgi:hypothetical protein